jgi:hypothetical protein
VAVIRTRPEIKRDRMNLVYLRHSLSQLLRKLPLLINPLIAPENLDTLETNRRPIEHEVEMASKRSDPLENHFLERVVVKHDASNGVVTALILDTSLAIHSKGSVEETAYRQREIALDSSFADDVASLNPAVAVPQLGARFVDWRVGENHVAIQLQLARCCADSYGACG